MDRLLIFAFSHQVVIIEIVFALILGIVVVWLFSHLRGESMDGEQSGRQIDDIQEALKRVLESTDLNRRTASQAASVIKDEDEDIAVPNIKITPATPAKAPSATPGAATTAGAGAIAVATPGAADGDVTKLRGEVEQKAQKLAELEKALAAAKDELQKAKTSGAGTPGGPNPDELLQKIKTLESRLSEYEIIEDDIANLSLYKEENLKLKAEIDRLRHGGAAPAAPVPSATTAAASAEMLAETVAISAEPAKTESAKAAPQGSPAPGDKDIDSDKLLKEFDDLMASDPKPAAAAPADEKERGDKLIEEFENFVKGGGG